MRFNQFLQDLYHPFGNEWVNQNGIVFLSAKKEGLAIAGSIAVAIGRKRAIRTPGDIDFVCATSDQARKFISRLEDALLKTKTYWRVQVNNQTAFCPEGCSTHFRIKAPFWLPVCVMVIGEVKQWRTYGGNLVQSFNDVIKAAQELDERDGKGRMDEEPREPVRSRIEDNFEIDLSMCDSEQGHSYP